MTNNIYVVRGLGLGDDEDTFENMCAFTNLAAAEAHIEELKLVDTDEGFEIEYEVETIELVN